jgi:hypothetical protein
LLIAEIAAVLLCAAAIYPLTASIQLMFGGSGSVAAPGESSATAPLAAAGEPAQGEPETRARARCADCAVIESTREIDIPADADATDGAAAGDRNAPQKLATRMYETVVRFQDGSMQVVSDANPTRWRPGERVIFIRGTDRTGP